MPPEPMSLHKQRFSKIGKLNAQLILRQLQQERSKYVSHWALALAYAGLEETERALTQLRESISTRSPQPAIFLSTDPRLDPLRSDSRFRQLETDLGLRTTT